jgi:hypothetical protein
MGTRKAQCLIPENPVYINKVQKLSGWARLLGKKIL